MIQDVAFSQSFNWDQLILHRIEKIVSFYDRAGSDGPSRLGFIHAVKGLKAVLAGDLDQTYHSDLEQAKRALDAKYEPKRRDKTKAWQKKVGEEYDLEYHYLEFLCLNKLIKRLKNS